jgi:hypothetical protein
MKTKLILLLGIITLYSCNNDEEVIGQFPLDGEAPGIVTNISVENGPGSAKISYSIPSDDDLLYVKATYNVNENFSREAEASYFNNELSLDGFGEAKPYTVSLVAVDGSKNKSAPVEVIVNPTKGPVVLAFETLTMVETFGGVNLQWKNESENNLDIEIYVDDPENEGFFIEETIIYTDEPDGNFNVRGYDPEPRTFRTTIVDRWGNKSDTLQVELIPLLEIELDKALWDLAINWEVHPAGPLQQLIDGIKGTSSNRALALPTNPPRPRIDIDLGKKAKFSRFLMDPWSSENAIFANTNQRFFKLYGSNDPSAYDSESFAAWEVIEENGEIVKPSGLPRGQLTGEDRLAFFAGFNTDISVNTPPYRYLRYEVVEDWTGTQRFMAGEFTFFGNYVE